MNGSKEISDQKISLRQLPRNVWALSLTSFFMDISSEMVINLLPLFLFNTLGVRTSVIGLIEGIGETTASMIKLVSGWISDRLRARKWLAVTGYALSAFTKPFFYFVESWIAVAVVRWADRVGKGIRTSPRDALLADSIEESARGIAFGLQRAADTAGAMLGLLITLAGVWYLQSSALDLNESTFRTIVLLSLVPAFLAVLTIATGAQDVPIGAERNQIKIGFGSLGKSFIVFLVLVCLFELGNSSDAFMIIRAQERGLSVLGILSMLVVFNLIYSLISTPAGALSDRIGRRRVIAAGWLIYASIYLGFGLAKSGWQAWLLYAIYGSYYGLTYGTSKAMVADLVSENVRGTAFGTYNAAVGLMAFPASFIAGILWQGIGSWYGFGPAAPFIFGAATALLAALLLTFWFPMVNKNRE
ncbi:MAG: MFS transporter [Anaerolineales bacterium]